MHRARSRLVLIPLAVTVVAFGQWVVAAPSPEQGWSQFRGPDRSGVSSETGWLKLWPESGPRELWRRPLGAGYSGISVAGERLFTAYGSGGDTWVEALDPSTGERLWRTRIDDKFRNNFGDGPRATPTVHGGRVYALSARGTLAALDAEAGRVVWRRSLPDDFGAAPPQWGYSGSPEIAGGRLLVDVGGKAGASIVAFALDDGSEVWRAESDGPGYSAPLPIEVGGLEQVVFFTASQLVSLSPSTGQVYWKVPWKTSYDVNAATPLFVPPDKLFVSTGYDVGAALYRIVVDSKRAGADVERIWQSRAMRNKFSSSVYRDGQVYGFDEKTLKCIDALTGSTRWQTRGLGHGSLLWSDGHLLVLSDEGTMVLVEATPESYVEKARFRAFDGRTWTVPTLWNERLFLRDNDEIVAFDLSRPENRK